MINYRCWLCCAVCVFLTACSSSVPSQTGDACDLLEEQSSWFTSAARSEREWGIPISIQLAIIYQESSFRSSALPEKNYLLGIIPWGRVSSAYGFPQALDGVWSEYLKFRGAGLLVSRSRFKDAVDFIGWYLDGAVRRTGISKKDAYNLYLVYHEGVAGYKKGGYKKNKMLLSAAKSVRKRSQMYQNQIDGCSWQLRLRNFYFL